jgi:hypothetical protein
MIYAINPANNVNSHAQIIYLLHAQIVCILMQRMDIPVFQGVACPCPCRTQCEFKKNPQNEFEKICNMSIDAIVSKTVIYFSNVQ